MAKQRLHIVTGAFGYSGKYITRRLLDAGCEVRTLTNSPNRANPFEGKVEAFPYNFDDADQLADSMRGASVLFNTYWVRYKMGGVSHADAVENSIRLFQAAAAAGVGRVVHVSITNPSEYSPLSYFRGKAQVERALVDSGLSHSILRPAILFGEEDILVNNIAWSLRRFPAIALFGDGRYRIRPIFVDDLAKLAVEEAIREENRVVDAVGPETFAYIDLVRTIASALGKKRFIVPAPAPLGFLATWALGKLLGDVIVTWDEVEGLMAGLLSTDSPATGETRLTDWIGENAASLGVRYSSELARRKNRRKAYKDL